MSRCHSNQQTSTSPGRQAEWVADANRAFDAVPRVPLASDCECWSLMPQSVSGGGVLPNWARALAPHMPRTVAAMLVLDHAQRTAAPLDAVLRAKIRWMVAVANRSIYGMAYAAADLGRAGASEADLAALCDPEQEDAERDSLDFASDLATDASAIGEEQFASLVEHYGERRVAAMVLAAAYGSFQDRLVTVLNLPLEKEGPLPPLPVHYASGPLVLTRGASEHPSALPFPASQPAVPIDPRWRNWDYEALQAELARRRHCRPRLPLPAWDSIRATLPPEYPTEEPLLIRWALVSLGYVPELAHPWNAAARLFWDESQQEPTYEASLLWIQSRVLECSYGMGHAEMMLELAGHNEHDVARLVRSLAEGEWSQFPLDEQLAFAFACLLTGAPWEVSDSDFDVLQRELGARRVMQTIWWLCRGVYFSQIAEALQLPLERENVLRPQAPRGPSVGTALLEKRAHQWKTA